MYILYDMSWRMSSIVAPLGHPPIYKEGPLTTVLGQAYNSGMTNATPESPQETLAQADSVLPRFDWDDDKKRGYLSYRLCGFGRDESCELAGTNGTPISRATIYRWMENDSEFAAIEKTNLLELQQQFSKEVITLDFTRNFKLALDHDYQILKKAQLATQNPSNPDYFFSKEERNYLSKIRPLYTPQQFSALQALFKDFNPDTGWDEMIFMARRTNGKNNQGSTDQTASRTPESPQGSIEQGR